MALTPGQIIDGKYKVVRLVGEGGMGTVYEGENSRIGRRVAIKVLHSQVASLPEFVERFEREARAAARIGSPHVCDVLDLGDLPGGDRYIVMEFLVGMSLEDRISQGPMSPEKLAPIAFELLEGLGTMHNARVIHRDLKPANVFLAKSSGGRGERVKILDFGVAKLLPFEGEVGTMTQTGSMMGTPLYMSPEQARGARDVDGRTDIYAASVMFYRALTGMLPYTADTLNELLFKIVLEDPRPLRDLLPDLDESFAAIIHCGLARDVNQRFATARDYQTAIAEWGRRQGRTSLQFAITMTTSDPPSAMPMTGGSFPPTPRFSGSSADGTPTAWSEDRPRVGSGSGPHADGTGPNTARMREAAAGGPALSGSSPGTPNLSDSSRSSPVYRGPGAPPALSDSSRSAAGYAGAAGPSALSGSSPGYPGAPPSALPGSSPGAPGFGGQAFGPGLAAGMAPHAGMGPRPLAGSEPRLDPAPGTPAHALTAPSAEELARGATTGARHPSPPPRRGLFIAIAAGATLLGALLVGGMKWRSHAAGQGTGAGASGTTTPDSPTPPPPTPPSALASSLSLPSPSVPPTGVEPDPPVPSSAPTVASATVPPPQPLVAGGDPRSGRREPPRVPTTPSAGTGTPATAAVASTTPPVASAPPPTAPQTPPTKPTASARRYRPSLD